MKKHLIRFALGLVVVLVFLANAADVIRIPFVERLELMLYDARLHLTMPGGVDDRIVIVDIDERSLAAEGQWPWRRDRVGHLVDQLFDHYQTGLVGFDVVFAEPDETAGLAALQALGQTALKDNAEFHRALDLIAPQLDYDKQFAEKLRGRPVVLGYYFSQGQGKDRQGQKSGMLPDPVLAPGTFTGKKVNLTTWVGYGANLPAFQQAAAGGGHFNPWPDEDGITRRVPMLAEYEGAYYEPLSLALVRLGLGFPEVIPGFPEVSMFNKKYPGLEWLEAGGIRIPVDDMGTALVPYRGPERSFAYVSATDVLESVVPVAMLQNKIVLVGTSAPGLFDLRATPVGKVYAGVEIHANLIAGILDGTIKQRPSYVLGAEVALLLLFGLFLTVALPLLSPLRATLLTAAVLAGLFGLNLAVWVNGSLVLPLTSGLLMTVLLFALNMSYGFFVESRAKRQITSRFGQYVPPELVDEMSRHPESISMEGESRELSVLFTDVRGFTTISEALDPKELTKLMNEFLTPLTRTIHGHRGTIDKYMGDCIMAFWGAPLDDPAHARNAVLAGLEMHKILAQLAPDFRARNWPEIHIGVGVNTGRMVVGNMGSEVRVAYTVMGDAVNLASRLEGITKQYGVPMIVGERTRSMISDIVFRELDKVRVKGKEEPVTIYQPVGLQGEINSSTLDELKLWAQFLRFYRSCEWDTAELQLLNLQRAEPTSLLYRTFLERIAEFRRNPPEMPWDGAYRFEAK